MRKILLFCGIFCSSSLLQFPLHQAPGIYFVTVRTAGQTYTSTLVKK